MSKPSEAELQAMRAGYRNAISDATEIIDRLKARLEKHELREERLAVSELKRCADLIWALRDKEPFTPMRVPADAPIANK